MIIFVLPHRLFNIPQMVNVLVLFLNLRAMIIRIKNRVVFNGSQEAFLDGDSSMGVLVATQGVSGGEGLFAAVIMLTWVSHASLTAPMLECSVELGLAGPIFVSLKSEEFET